MAADPTGERAVLRPLAVQVDRSCSTPTASSGRLLRLPSTPIEYFQEFKEVRDYGVSTGSLRSPDQTETALFFSDIGVGPYQAALRDLVTRHGLSISDSARLFAAVDVSLADATFAVWDGKFHYGKWRPITAIQEADTDGDPNTTGVPGWTPLITTPPYPDYPSGLSGVTGALSTALSRLTNGQSI